MLPAWKLIIGRNRPKWLRWPGDVFSHFCEIDLAFPRSPFHKFLLKLTDPPEDEQVRALIRDHGGKRIERGRHVYVFVALALSDSAFIRKLGAAIGRVTSLKHIHRTGERYEEGNWKWLAPRTKKSLTDLADFFWACRKELAAACSLDNSARNLVREIGGADRCQSFLRSSER